MRARRSIGRHAARTIGRVALSCSSPPRRPNDPRSTLGSAFNPFVISYARRKLPEQSRSALNATGYGRLCNSAQDTVVSRDSSVCIAFVSFPGNVAMSKFTSFLSRDNKNHPKRKKKRWRSLFRVLERARFCEGVRDGLEKKERTRNLYEEYEGELLIAFHSILRVGWRR